MNVVSNNKGLSMKYLWVLLMGILTSCSSMTDYFFEDTDVEFIDELKILSTPATNYGKPLRVDFVVSKHPVVTQQLGRLKAEHYMRHRRQLKLDHPKELKFHSYELVPGQSVVLPLSYPKKEVDGAFIFADFDNENVNRWTVFAADYVRVNLHEGTLTISSHNEDEQEKVKPSRIPDDVVIIDRAPL